MPVSDLVLVPASAMSSFGSSVWTTMPVDTVNTLTTIQLKGLAMPQINAIKTSPNFLKFSTNIQSFVNSFLGMQKNVVTVNTNGATNTQQLSNHSPPPLDATKAAFFALTIIICIFNFMT